MNADEASVALGLSGFALGAWFGAYKQITELEERCAFLTDVSQDIKEALRDADTVLADERTPEPVSELITILLLAHASEQVGDRLASVAFSRKQDANETSPEDNPVSVAMRELADLAPTLERKAHRAVMSLIIGLLVSHRSNHLQVSRVSNQAAKDPATVWSSVGSLLGLRTGSGTPRVSSLQVQ